MATTLNTIIPFFKHVWKKKSLYSNCLLLFSLCTFAFSCSDTIDDSNLYTLKGESIISYLQKNPDYSKYCYILSKTKLSKRTKSSLAELLSTRGNYTCFAPTNDAVQSYLDNVYQTTNFPIENITDSVAEDIAKNSLIDNGSETAYQTTDFNEGALDKTNMNDRYVTIKFKTSDEGKVVYLINNLSEITQPNIEVENGYIQVVDRVLAASNAYLPTIIAQAPNMQIAALLINETGWADSMRLYRDDDYELTKPETATSETGGTALVPEHRYFGYTAVLETDDVFEKEWGIPAPIVENDVVKNKEEILEKIKEKCNEIYPDFSDPNLTSVNNAVNYFISYHIIPARITYDKLVIHYAEKGYSYKIGKLSINCTELYETISQAHRRLIQFTEGESTNGIRINRHSVYDSEDYKESLPNDVANGRDAGLKVSPNNGEYEFNALNGFYYPIDGILVYDSHVRDVILNNRLRFDISALLPELMTNGIRRMNSNLAVYIPDGYFDNITILSSSTQYRYLPSYGLGYPNYQGDEHNIQGSYDFVLKLPPVPYKGTWEIRWSVPIYSNRGMAQLYLGSDKNNLPAIGLPLDLRLYAENPSIGWKADTGDEVTDRETDKSMRAHGYMKPVNHDGPTTGSVVEKTLRDQSAYQRLRKIIYTGTIGPEDVLYLRVKSILANTATMFVMDHMELCPKSVYAGATPEDKW